MKVSLIYKLIFVFNELKMKEVMHSKMCLTILLASFIIQTAVAANNHHEEIDIVFIVDGSSHGEEILFRRELLLIPSVIQHLEIEKLKPRFALITYSNHPDLQIELGSLTNNKALIGKLWKIRRDGGDISSLCYALKLARIHIFRNSKCCLPKFLVIFTNGKWNLPRFTQSESVRLREMGVKILLLALGDRVDRFSARQLTSSSNIVYRPQITLNYVTNQWIFNTIVQNIRNVQETFVSTQSNSTIKPSERPEKTKKPTTQLITRPETTKVLTTQSFLKPETTKVLTTQSLLKPETTKVAASQSSVTPERMNASSTHTFMGPSLTTVVATHLLTRSETTNLSTILSSTSHKSTQSLTKQQSTTISTTMTSIGPILPKDPPCQLSGELVFILDSSLNMNLEDFREQIQLSLHVLDKLRIDRTMLAVAVLNYGMGATINLSFQTFQLTENLNETMLQIPFVTGNTGSGEALSLANRFLFQNKPNARIKRIVVLFLTSLLGSGPDPVVVSHIMKISNDIKIVLIALQGNIDSWVETAIASSANTTIMVNDFKSLASVRERLVNILCSV